MAKSVWINATKAWKLKMFLKDEAKQTLHENAQTKMDCK